VKIFQLKNPPQGQSQWNSHPKIPPIAPKIPPKTAAMIPNTTPNMPATMPNNPPAIPIQIGNVNTISRMISTDDVELLDCIIII
jgi:hypothetical protein